MKKQFTQVCIGGAAGFLLAMIAVLAAYRGHLLPAVLLLVLQSVAFVIFVRATVITQFLPRRFIARGNKHN